MASLGVNALAAAGLTTLDILSPGAPQRNIGGIVAQITVDETGVDTLTITKHPVEQGANISDHVYKEPASVTIRVGWSDSSLAALGGAASAALAAQSVGAAIGAFTSPSYVSDVYAQLLALQITRQPFTIVTGKRTYKNMEMKSLSQTTDVETEYALFATLVCEEVLLAVTSTTTVPSPSVQADPASTASPQALGPVQPAPATSVNRGAFLPSAATPGNVFQIPVQPSPINTAPTPGTLGGPI